MIGPFFLVIYELFRSLSKNLISKTKISEKKLAQNIFRPYTNILNDNIKSILHKYKQNLNGNLKKYIRIISPSHLRFYFYFVLIFNFYHLRQIIFCGHKFIFFHHNISKNMFRVLKKLYFIKYKFSC